MIYSQNGDTASYSMACVWLTPTNIKCFPLLSLQPYQCNVWSLWQYKWLAANAIGNAIGDWLSIKGGCQYVWSGQ